jgi:hypothetical protein
MKSLEYGQTGTFLPHGTLDTVPYVLQAPAQSRGRCIDNGRAGHLGSREDRIVLDPAEEVTATRCGELLDVARNVEVDVRLINDDSAGDPKMICDGSDTLKIRESR